MPYGETTAKNGHWVKGPGMKLVGVLTSWFHDMEYIAEDLGFQTPEVEKLLKDSKLPGMKVLEFAFDSREPSNYLPHTYPKNCVCYVGTHDNAPLQAWKDECDPADMKMAKKYLGLNGGEGLNRGMIRGGMSSVADLFIAQMQDFLNLGAESRMNTPGLPAGNWQWRMTEGQADKKRARPPRQMSRNPPRLPKRLPRKLKKLPRRLPRLRSNRERPPDGRSFFLHQAVIQCGKEI